MGRKARISSTSWFLVSLICFIWVFMSWRIVAYMGYAEWASHGRGDGWAHYLAMPCCFGELLLAAAVVVTAGLGIGRWAAEGPARRRRRIPPGRCACGYDLTGNVSGRCPECGRAVHCACGYDLTGHASGRCPYCGRKWP